MKAWTCCLWLTMFGLVAPAGELAWKFQTENDLYNCGLDTLLPNNDREYSAGELFALCDGVNTWSIQNQMYTPDNIKIPDVQPGQHPTVGVMLFSWARRVDLLTNGVTTTTLTGGWSGRYAGSEAFQKFIHDDLGRGGHPACWAHQLGPDLLYAVSVRHEQKLLDGGWWQAWAFAQAEAGNLTTRASSGGEVRAGWNLPDRTASVIQLTAPLRQPWRLYGTFSYSVSDVGWSYYLQGAADRQDANLIGIMPERYVHDYIGGVHLQTPAGWFAAYLYDFRTREFAEQQAPHGWGSVTIGKGWEF